MNFVKRLLFYPPGFEHAGRLRATWFGIILLGCVLAGGYVDGYYCLNYNICD